MPNKNYKRGASFEYERVAYHKENGAIVATRTPGSHTPFDVMAQYPTHDVYEQLKRCKRINKNGDMPASIRKEMIEFMDFAYSYTGSENIYCFYVRVDGKKEPLLLFST